MNHSTPSEVVPADQFNTLQPDPFWAPKLNPAAPWPASIGFCQESRHDPFNPLATPVSAAEGQAQPGCALAAFDPSPNAMKLITVCFYPVLAPPAGRYPDESPNHHFVVRLPEDRPVGPVAAAHDVFKAESESWSLRFNGYNSSSGHQIAEMPESEFEKLPLVDGCGPSIRRDPRY
mgnify:CR=1 FL=1